MATRTCFNAPTTIYRVGGTWMPTEAGTAHVTSAVIESADRPGPDERPGEFGKMLYLGGRRYYDVADDTMAAIAELRATTKVNGLTRTVTMKDWIATEVSDDPIVHRTHAPPSLWTRGQTEYLNGLEARIAALEGVHHPPVVRSHR